MNRPKNKRLTESETRFGWQGGYNRACRHWEAWLKEVASVEKIEKVILNTQKELEKMSGIRLFPEDRKELAKTISKSILGG